MRFDIDYSTAKTMATRLQDFLEGSPKKLSRSSSIEAIARVLGFNNRNEMSARLQSEEAAVATPSSVEMYEQVINEVATWRNDNPMTGEECYNTIRMRLTDLGGAQEATSTPVGSSDPQNPREAALGALNELRIKELEDTAKAFVKKGREHAPDEDFWDAMHAEAPGFEGYVLAIVENRILQNLLMDPQRRALLSGIFCESAEMEGAREEGLNDLPSQLARTLVNEALPQAERLWNEA